MDLAPPFFTKWCHEAVPRGRLMKAKEERNGGKQLCRQIVCRRELILQQALGALTRCARAVRQRKVCRPALRFSVDGRPCMSFGIDTGFPVFPRNAHCE
jgi:hypothetical protein